MLLLNCVPELILSPILFKKLFRFVILKNNSKHILFLPRWYPNRYDNMWGLFVKKHAEAVSQFHQLSILYLHPVEGLKKDEWEIEKNDSIYTLYIYYSKPKNRIAYFMKFFRLYFKGLKHINTLNPIDLIHVHILTRMGLLALVSKLRYNIPYVITEHWSRYLPTVKVYAGWLRKRLTEWVIKKSKAVMPVTQNLKEAMENHGLSHYNYQIVPNVVDDVFFKLKDIPRQHIQKRIIHVSTFEDKSKNISGIIEAIHIIKNSRSDFKMVFVGEGMDFKRMQNKVNQLKLEDQIEFTGLLEKEALVNEYEKATFMLVNSNYENMPVVINEAFATGLPVLSTNVGGISEHLNNERGKLIEARETKQLVEQLNWMLDHYQKFDSSQIKEYAQERFSMKSVGSQIVEIYEEILNKK